jgi:Transposase DDE domain
VYIRRTRKKYKGKSYFNYVLVESQSTPKGPRQKTVCSLGSLEPAPREQWLALAQRIEAALSDQLPLAPEEDSRVRAVAEQVRTRRARVPRSQPLDWQRLIAIDPARVAVEEAREAGPVYVGHQIWRELGLPQILARAGLTERACALTEAMVLNRLIAPRSEHAMPDWIRRCALEELLQSDFSTLSEASLYRNLDQLHPRREPIETALAERERTLFNLDDTLLLYDLTSTYFEGLAERNPQAQRGYSRDQRPDCKQVVVGLVLNGDGFPKAHEIFAGNRHDSTTLDEMLSALERRTGKRSGCTVVVDRGMADAANLQRIKTRGHHYLVAARQPERDRWLAEFEETEGFEQVLRLPSPRNPAQVKSQVMVKRAELGDQVYALCLSEDRQDKDRAIREKQESRLLKDLERLATRVGKGQLKQRDLINQAIGRLRERYPRVARYYRIEYEQARLVWQEDSIRKARAEQLDGAYLLKTDRQDLNAEEIWRIYNLLTRVETAFRTLKSPLVERPIFHQLEHRTQTHIFLCVLAYHLLVCIEKRFLDRGIHTSWWTLRQQLTTHQLVTVVLPASNGAVLKIRQATNPEPIHREIYSTLGISSEVIKPIRTWHEA